MRKVLMERGLQKTGDGSGDGIRQFVPIQMRTIPMRMRTRSMIFARRLRSLKMMTPHAKEIMTELRRTSDTTDIIEEGSFRDVKYAKSPMQMNMDISGMAQLQRNGVDWLRCGYQSTEQMMVIMIS